MRYLHTMLRVRNLDAALKFYQDALGLKEVRRVDNDKAKFTLVFLCAAEDEGLLKASKGRGAPLVELTYNWDEEKYGEDRYFGHLAYEVDDIYATCDRLMKQGITINRPPRDGNMAFVRSPDLHSIELLQKGDPKPPAEPWTSMPNTGHWEAQPSRSEIRSPDRNQLFRAALSFERERRRRRWDEEFLCGCWACRSRLFFCFGCSSATEQNRPRILLKRFAIGLRMAGPGFLRGHFCRLSAMSGQTQQRRRAWRD